MSLGKDMIKITSEVNSLATYKEKIGAIAHDLCRFVNAEIVDGLAAPKWPMQCKYKSS